MDYSYFISFATGLLCLTAGVADAFSTPSPPPLSPLTQQALDVYNQRFPFEGESKPVTNVMGDFGMPNQDFSGKPKAKSSGKRFGEIPREKAEASYNELAALYGDARALEMVKALPICLAFDQDNFAPQLAAWKEIFGEEPSLDMVARNPGLLAVRADDAATSNGQTMFFSYVVAYTRPVGGFLLFGLLFALLVPAIESVLGISITSSVSGGM
jgi:hypothetical protein